MEELVLSAIFLACIFGIITLFAKVVSDSLNEGYKYRRDREETDEDEGEDYRNN